MLEGGSGSAGEALGDCARGTLVPPRSSRLAPRSPPSEMYLYAVWIASYLHLGEIPSKTFRKTTYEVKL